jgi:hypothetical protein
MNPADEPSENQPHRPEQDRLKPDSLANLPPQPFDISLTQGFVITGAIGGFLLLISAGTGRTAGATRSTKVTWLQRQAEMQQAEIQAVDSQPIEKQSTQTDARDCQ